MLWSYCWGYNTDFIVYIFLSSIFGLAEHGKNTGYLHSSSKKPAFKAQRPFSTVI